MIIMITNMGNMRMSTNIVMNTGMNMGMRTCIGMGPNCTHMSMGTIVTSTGARTERFAN
jgi:hypothetical protein